MTALDAVALECLATDATAYLPAGLVREANYATSQRRNVAVHLSHKYGITARQLGPNRVVADGHDLLKLKNSGWYMRPEGPALSVGVATYGLPGRDSE